MITLEKIGTGKELVLVNENISLNYSVNELGTIENRNGFVSNDFDLPLSSEVIAWINFSTQVNVQNNFQVSRKINAILRQNGAVLGIGFVQINNIDAKSNTCNVTFFSGNTAWFELVKDIQLKELDISEFNHLFTEANIVASWANETGYIYPFVDYGRLFDIAPDLSTPTVLKLPTDIEDWLPAVYVSTLLNRVEKQIGFRFEGSFFSSLAFKKMVIPFSAKSKYILAPDFVAARKSVAEGAGNYSGAGGLQLFDFQTVAQGVSNCFDLATDTYTVNAKGTYIVSVEANTTLTGDLILISSDNPTISVPLFNGSIFANINMESGGTFRVFIEPTPSEPSTPISIIFTVELSRTGLIEDGLVEIVNYLPDLKVSDLLKHLAVCYNLFFVVDSYRNIINVFSFDEVCNNTNVTDWTHKLVYSNYELKFSEFTENYGQNSLFAYKEVDTDSELTAYNSNKTVAFGNGQLELINDFIDKNKTVFSSVFAPTINTESFEASTYLPQITIWNGTDYLLDPKPRIGFIVKNDVDIETLVSGFVSPSTFAVTINAGTNRLQVPMFSFFKRVLNNTAIDFFKESLAFETPEITEPNDNSLFEMYYQKLNAVLNDNKLLKTVMQLSAVDIQSINTYFQTPIYLGEPFNAYFLLNKIENFNPANSFAQVELIKL